MSNNDGALFVKETGQLKDCIVDKQFPKEYTVKREEYVLEIASLSGFKGRMPRLYFHATNKADISLSVSGMGVALALVSNPTWQYVNYQYQWVADDMNVKQLNLVIKDVNKDTVGEEKILFTVEFCKAIENDAL